MKENDRQKSQLFSVKLGFFFTVWGVSTHTYTHT